MAATPASSTCNATEHLGDDEVHVWHFAYQHEHGRAPLLTLLARYLGGTAGDVHLIEGEHGRPQFDQAPDATLDFNWSHSGNHAATFLELWTAKEAVLKANGRGIAFGLHRLRVASGVPLRLAWLDGDDANAWQLQRVQLDDAYVAALAWRGGTRHVRVRRLATPA